MLLSHLVWNLAITASGLVGHIGPVFPFQCPWWILARDHSTITSRSSPQLICCWWWFRLCWERVYLAATWNQGQGPCDCPLSALKSRVFPKLLDVLLLFTQQQYCVPILSTHHSIFNSAIPGMFALLVYFDLIFLTAWGLEVGEFLPVPSRAVPQICERTRFLSCRVMSAALERSLERILNSLHSPLGEETMLPNPPGCSASCCHLAVTGLAVAFIQTLVTSFPLLAWMWCSVKCSASELGESLMDTLTGFAVKWTDTELLVEW